MDETTRNLMVGLREAMQAERYGQAFYQNAAMTTADPQGKEVFEQLAREEREHFEFLAAHYKSLLTHQTPAAGVRLVGHAKVDSASPIFSSQLHARIKEAHFEMSALAIAVQLELNAITHYRAMAEKTSIPEVKRFFEELASWEKSHYDAFLHQQQALQDEYWTASGFSPF
ncbi:MAG TPA: ferritin family protein [Polyangiaceae bacterium]|jgi:rubrerythrin|nr:MAG: putative trifunctional 2-polyprenylphenol hydroxylase/glutamate synthase subunit beta/ferritin domain-containing protein [Deltaproteobacteria bacterium ADurb.Bin207]HNS96563.1 ferritin family protein [Polyangiaceae bacterium]HNZ24797.1 ferritin family protein [Polyangiaceae bacterium]HOD22013.1 ferritin family protein [Polyangiaceae bacterium]HOE47979.1 ferritin family protein [Polyangiaceae bacterium]